MAANQAELLDNLEKMDKTPDRQPTGLTAAQQQEKAGLIASYNQNRDALYPLLPEPLGFASTTCSYCTQLLPFFPPHTASTGKPSTYFAPPPQPSDSSQYLTDARLACGHAICPYCLLFKTDKALAHAKFAPFLCCHTTSPDLEYIDATYRLAAMRDARDGDAAIEYLRQCCLYASIAVLECANVDCDGVAEQMWLRSHVFGVGCDRCEVLTCRVCKKVDHPDERCNEVDLMNVDAEDDWAKKLELAHCGWFRCVVCRRRIQSLGEKFNLCVCGASACAECGCPYQTICWGDCGLET